jgi:thiol:disulfide interchange protein
LFTVESKSISSQSQFFPFDENTMDFSSEQISENGNLSFEVFEDFTGTLKGVISSENSFFEVEKAGTVSVNSDVGISLLTAILFAFIGGLILNLMPCVTSHSSESFVSC